MESNHRPYLATTWHFHSREETGETYTFPKLLCELWMYCGRNLASRRREKRLTRTELAEFLGITTEHMSAIERGQEQPSVELLLAASLKLGAVVDQFLRFSILRGELLELDAFELFGEAICAKINSGDITEKQVIDIDPAWKKRKNAIAPTSRHISGATEIADLAGVDITPFLPDTFPISELDSVREGTKQWRLSQASMRKKKV